MPMIIGFVLWWFTYVPAQILHIIKKTIAKLWNFFSVDLLFKTLLLPWKRDVIDTTNMSLQAKFQVMIMNLVSRLVGAVVRGGTILIGLLAIAGTLLLGLITLVGFILLPAVAILLIIYSLTGRFIGM